MQGTLSKWNKWSLVKSSQNAVFNISIFFICIAVVQVYSQGLFVITHPVPALKKTPLPAKRIHLHVILKSKNVILIL